MKPVQVLLILFALVVLVLATSGCQSKQGTPQLSEQEWSKRIETSLQQEQLEEATRQGKDALDQFPD